MRQCVEGATVGPGDFTFRTAEDVIRIRDVPSGFAAVLSGHIHRQQVMTKDLRGGPVAAPVLYPGSIERTSLAEIGEPKGFMIVDVGAFGNGGALRWQFRRLPARPMMERQTDEGAARYSRSGVKAQPVFSCTSRLAPTMAEVNQARAHLAAPTPGRNSDTPLA
jgi:DNA repair exonuclease SbcCD nuclease subunit